MSMKTCERAVRAGAILAAFALSGGAFAAGASGDSYSFESGTTLGSGELAGLSGNGTVVACASYPGAVNYPIPGADHTKVLEIAGTVTYTNDTTSTTPSNSASQVDFMFKVEPTDELENIDDATVQVALAVGLTNNAAGTTAPIKLWCKGSASGAAAGSASWVDLKTVNTGNWVRATLVMDYSATKCKVSLDGDYVGEYHFAGTAVQQYVKSITMVGSTAIDDLVIKHESNAEYNPYKNPDGSDITAPAFTDGIEVTLKYLNDYGIQTNEVNTVKNATSGMTVAQKFAAGLNPTSDTKFELKTMTPLANNQMKVTFPGDGSTYTVKVTSDRAGTVQTSSTTETSDSGSKTEAGETINEATVTLSDSGVSYIHLKATK